MALYGGWFGNGSPDGYPESSFTRQLDGHKYWEVKKILYEFFYGMECGFIKNLMPSTNCSLDEETVNACLEKLTFEWEKEQQNRGGQDFLYSPNFTTLLEPNQKLALVEAILNQYPAFANNAKAWKKNAKEGKIYNDDFDC